MQHEIKMASEQQLKHGLPVREEPPEGGVAMELVSRRRLLRAEITDFIKTLGNGDVVEFSIKLGRVAFAVAGTCAQFGSPPGFDHYAEALSEAMDAGMRDLDRALQSTDWHATAVATAKLQIIWMGCAANLGMPYGGLMTYLHDCYISGQPVEGAAVRDLLKKGRGILRPPTIRRRRHEARRFCPGAALAFQGGSWRCARDD